MSDYAEWRRFQQGERVRARISGECPRTSDRLRTMTINGLSVLSHRMEDDGMSGTVTFARGDDPHVIGHYYLVVWDRALDPAIPGGDWLAAAELEPLGETPDS